MPADHPELAALRFDNSFVRALPADPISESYVRQVHGAGFSRVSPTAVRAPKLVAYSREVAQLLGLSEAACQSQAFAELFAGNTLLPGMEPFAACYGGHQFGNWAGQLGDGRAISLGETIQADGKRWELQLKGAGPTPYSRSADGRAVLRSSLREFLCSEAMFHLGVPTTRALSLVSTGEPVLRDILYNGNARHEPGAVVCRVAPSFIRFGNFELFAARDELELLERLCNYTLATQYPELSASLVGAHAELRAALYTSWFAEICRRTVVMVVHWMRVGFVHGVMNTDNMSILGLTIDYGPYGFLEPYEPGWTPNITDAAGRRYRYENQPRVAMWNLVRLANALLPLVGETTPLEQVLHESSELLERSLHEMNAQKLGLRAFQAEPHFAGDHVLRPDAELLDELFAVLQLVETDTTLFFRKLSEVQVEESLGGEPSDDTLLAPIMEAYYAPDQLPAEARARMLAWLRRYADRVRADGSIDSERKRRMDAVNPKYVLRNYLAQLAIDQAEAGDPALVNELLDVLRHPYDEQPDKQRFAEKRPDWARDKAGCSMLSCSS